MTRVCVDVAHASARTAMSFLYEEGALAVEADCSSRLALPVLRVRHWHPSLGYLRALV